MIIRKRSKEATATICYIDGYGNKAQRREYFTVRVPSQTMVFNLDTKNLKIGHSQLRYPCLTALFPASVAAIEAAKTGRPEGEAGTKRRLKPLVAPRPTTELSCSINELWG